MKVPINRLISPETIGGGMNLEGRQVGYSSGVLDFSNNSTTDPLLMGQAQEEELNMEFGVARVVDFFVRVPKESSTLLGIKVQVLGDPSKEAKTGSSLAFTLGKGNSQDTFEDTFTIELKSDVTDYSVIYGYRASEVFAIYMGGSVSNYRFRGTISGASGLSSNEVDYEANNIQGFHAGFILGTSGFRIKGEYAIQRIHWSHTDELLYQNFGLAIRAGW